MTSLRKWDRLTLRGVRAHGRHGVHEHERAEGQTFVVDATLSLGTQAAAATDDLAQTIDYGAVAGELVDIVEGEPFQLIETLADRLAAACLKQPGVQEVEITVHKPEAPLTVPFDDVTITIHRSHRSYRSRP
jgi:7,8-dihydroneopterin aldolase/epimerase/oxygenase